MAGAGAQAATEEGAAPFLGSLRWADEGLAHVDKHLDRSRRAILDHGCYE